METAHLLRSPRNARRLLAALRRAEARTGKPQPVAKLRQEMGLGPSAVPTYFPEPLHRTGGRNHRRCHNWK
jgi:hypothetical protein